jgi:hypothetical protein
MGTHIRRLSIALAASAALVLPAAGSATPASTSFTIVGYEYAFTSTVGSFAGRGTGDASETALWNAVVKHDRLGTEPAYVNGGSFAMATRSAGGGLDAVAGSFTHHGGTITTISRGANCTNQRYRVAAAVQDVRTLTSAGGSGQFAVTLTHFRKRLFDRCVAYKARVDGTVAFTYEREVSNGRFGAKPTRAAPT